MGPYRKLQQGWLVFLTLLVLTACSGSTPPTAVPSVPMSTATPAPTQASEAVAPADTPATATATPAPTRTPALSTDPTAVSETPVATAQLVTPAPPVEAASTTVSEPAATAGTEAALLARAQEANQAWGNWLAMYKYNSPRYRETCKSGDYLAWNSQGMLILHTYMGIPEDAKIETRLDKVVITVESEGRVHGSLLVDGELLEFSEDEPEGDRWVFLDGQWWREPEDWREGCPLLDLTTELKPTAGSPPVPLSFYTLGEAITIDSSQLRRNAGQSELTGQIVLTFREHESTGEIEDQFTGPGMIKSRGQFVIVYYAVMNNLNLEIQPATQVNYRLYVTDDKGRRWEIADYTGNYGNVSGSAAVAKGYEQPASHVPPGFEQVTAAVFEVPADAQNLVLVWEKAGVKVSLN